MTDDRMPYYNELIDTIFDKEEREKFEWMVGPCDFRQTKDWKINGFGHCM